jgi:hypothetical protein
LVKLEDQYNNFSTVESKYDTRTHGVLVAVPKVGVKYDVEDIALMLNKRVYFEEYKEGARIKRGNDLFCFIEIADIRGYEEITPSAS